MAGSLLTGEPFLGEFDVEPISGSVLVLNYELTQDMTAEWMSDLNLTAHDRLLTLNIRGQTVPLLSDDGAAWLIDLCQTHGVEVLRIDPAARMMTAAGKHDENDNNAVKLICDRLDFIKAEAGVSEMIVAIHASRTDPVCRPRGADSWTGWMDSQDRCRSRRVAGHHTPGCTSPSSARRNQPRRRGGYVLAQCDVDALTDAAVVALTPAGCLTTQDCR